MAGFIRTCSGGRWFHSGSLGSLGYALGSFRVVGFIRYRPGGRCIHFGGAIGGVVLSWVHSGAPWSHRVRLGLLGSFRHPLCVVVFIRAHPGGPSVNLGTLWGSTVSFGVVVFIPECSYVHSGAQLGSSGSFGFVEFIRERPGC